MQSGVIDGILSIEDEADRIVENAENEAEAIVAKANDEAGRLVAAVLEAARNEGQSAVDEAESVLRSHLAMYELEKERILSGENHVSSEELERASERIVECILSTDHARQGGR